MDPIVSIGYGCFIFIPRVEAPRMSKADYGREMKPIYNTNARKGIQQ